MSPFVLSIETTEGVSEQYPYHLGTDIQLAKRIIEEKFAAYVGIGKPVVTMALMRDNRIVDVYYGGGQWDSRLGEESYG